MVLVVEADMVVEVIHCEDQQGNVRKNTILRSDSISPFLISSLHYQAFTIIINIMLNGTYSHISE